MIALTDVWKSYGKTVVLRDVSLRVHPGEFLCITGPSGAGKSTLIKLLTGAEPVSRGVLEVDGIDLRDVPPEILQLYRQRIGVMFQDYKLLQHLTVAENIAFPLDIRGVSNDAMTERVNHLLAHMNLSRHANALPSTLSGGQQASTALARAVAAKPVILLADEPTGNLDPDQSAEILGLLKEIQLEGTTVILATHDSGLVDALQPRVVRLEEGAIVRDTVGTYRAEVTEQRRTIAAVTQKTEKVVPGKRKVKVTNVG